MKTKKKPRINVTVRRKEKRSGASYARPADWLMDILVGDKSTSGIVVNESTALNYAVVFACVRNISEDIAKLPLILYRRLDKGGKERADSLPLYRILKDAPNEEMSSMDFRQAMTVDALLGTGGYAEIQRTGGGQPVALYKLERNRVTPRRNAAGKIVYEYRDPNKQEPVPITAENMLHIKGIGDGLVGWSVIKLARQSIGLALAADATGASFFGNGSLPSGVLQTEEKVSEQAMKNLRESWERVHGGPENKNKIAILEQGLKFNPMSVSNEDSQFLETRQFEVEDVCRWFRMPPHKVGHLMRATGWSTLEATNTDYIIDTLMPWSERWEQEIQRKLIPASDRTLFVEHLFDALLRGDTTARSAFYREQFNIGAMSQNDVRESENRNPIAGGDVYYVPLNMVPSEIAAKGPQKDPIPAPAPTDMPKEPSKDPKVKREKIKSVQDAHAGMLEEGLARMLKVEGERAQRHRNKAGFAAWVDSFYVEHQLHVRACVGWSLEAFAAAIWALSADGAMPEAVAGLVRSQIDLAALRHVNLSKLEVDNAETFEATAERVANQANVELVLMTDLIEKLAGEFK